MAANESNRLNTIKRVDKINAAAEKIIPQLPEPFRHAAEYALDQGMTMREAREVLLYLMQGLALKREATSLRPNLEAAKKLGLQPFQLLNSTELLQKRVG